MYNQEDDLKYAIEYNGLKSYQESDIEEIAAEVPGENDEFSWWWILRLSDNRFTLLSGWCDYSGWDCQSGVEEYAIVSTALEAANLAPESEYRSKRQIKKQLIAQVEGSQPKFTYEEAKQ